MLKKLTSLQQITVCKDDVMTSVL